MDCKQALKGTDDQMDDTQVIQPLRQKYSENPESSRLAVRVGELGRHERYEPRTACHLDVFRRALTLERSASCTHVLEGKQILDRHRQYNMK
jgi:hypothetical protein